MLVSATVVSYPIGTDDGAELGAARYRPPLGLLLVADLLESLKVRVRLVDLSIELVRHIDEGFPTSSFAVRAATQLAEHNSELYGFSTISGTMPLSVRIAQELRRRLPHACIGFAGPGASSVARALVQAFPEIDFVLRGEAENSLSRLVETFGTERFFSVPNLVYRARRDDGAERERPAETGIVIENPSSPVATRYPTPSYSRWGYSAGLPFLPIEVGRGCPFSCTFCSTNDFFSKQYRLKDPAALTQDLAELQRCEAPLGYDFVHDNFTIDQSKTREICRHIRAVPSLAPWNCSSHIRCISPALIEDMAAAGCNSIFFGIESGSERMQKVFRKNLPLDKVLPTAEACAKHGIAFAGGFIIGFPEETLDDLAKTVNMIVDLLAIKNTIPCVSILSPLGGTGYFSSYRDTLKLDRIATKIAFQGKSYRADEWNLIENHRDVFPEFYSFPNGPVSRVKLKLLEDYLTGAWQTVRYLLVGLRRMGYCALETAFEWFDLVGEQELSRPLGYNYYTSLRFRERFVDFYRSMTKRARVTADERKLFDGLAAPYAVGEAILADRQPTHLNRPTLRPHVAITHGPVSLSRMPLRLASLAGCDEHVHDSTYVHVHDGAALRTIEHEPVIGSLLDMCTGTLSVDDICSRMESEWQLSSPACKFVLGSLEKQGLLQGASQ